MKKSLLTILFIRLIEQLLFFIGLVLMQVYVNKSISMYLVKGAWWDACEVLTLRLVFTEFIHVPILLKFLKERVFVRMMVNALSFMMLTLIANVILSMFTGFFIIYLEAQSLIPFFLACCVPFLSPFIANLFTAK
jgi:hypothetical protein